MASGMYPSFPLDDFEESLYAVWTRDGYSSVRVLLERVPVEGTQLVLVHVSREEWLLQLYCWRRMLKTVRQKGGVVLKV